MKAWTASSCNFVRTTKPRPIAGSDRRTANVATTSVGRSPDPSPQTVVPASLFSLPFPDSTFSAGCPTSTFQHVPDERIDEALAEFVRVLVPGAPVTIGLWGGHDEVIDSTSSTSGLDRPRHFTLRSHDRIRSILH